MSVFGCVGRLWGAYTKELNLGLARKMMKTAHAKKGSAGGAYGSVTAFNKWSRGYTPGGGSTWKTTLARRGTVWGAGALAASAGGGLAGKALVDDRRKKRGR